MRIPVFFPVPYVRTDRYAGHPGLKDHEEATFEEAVKSATECLRQRGMWIEYSESTEVHGKPKCSRKPESGEPSVQADDRKLSYATT
jgi:hypothetical protein